MTAKEQIKFCADVDRRVKERGIRVDAFLSRIPLSGTHWHFLKKGDRVLKPALKEKISEVIESAF